MSYIGHGLSHAIFGGFAASALLGVSFFLGAGIWGIASALAINGVTRRRRDRRRRGDRRDHDRVLRARPRALRALRTGGQSFDAALFGSILGVSTSDVLVIAGVAALAVAVVFLQYRPLLFTTFDPEVAEASGVRTARVEALLMLVLALTILSTMQVLGVTLVAASVVIPAVVARMLTDSFARMLLLATRSAAHAVLVGMNVSYHANVQSGPTIVLTGAALFVAVFAWSSLRARAPPARAARRVTVTRLRSSRRWVSTATTTSSRPRQCCETEGSA